MAESEAEPSPSPSPPLAAGAAGAREWAVLYRYPLLVGPEQLPRRADFKADLDVPPRSSVLCVSRGVLQDPGNPCCLAFLNCVDETGRLLLVSATQGAGTERLIVCQAGSGKACALPAVPASLHLQIAIGDATGIVPEDPLAAGSGGDSCYIVSQLHPAPAAAPSPISPGPAAEPAASPNAAAPAPSLNSAGPGAATPSAPAPGPGATAHLLCFTSRSKAWSLKDVEVSCPRDFLAQFHVDTVVPYLRRLAFVDFARGIIACDPRLEHQQARLIPFPVDCDDDAITGAHPSTIRSRRCVAVSDGRLRFLCISGLGAAAVFHMWSSSLDCDLDWTEDYRDVPVREMWSSQNDQKAGLPPGMVPSIGVVHPTNASIVYFLSGSEIFSVQLSTRQIISSDVFFLDLGTSYFSNDMSCWVLPPSPLQPSQHETSSAGSSILKVLKRSGKALRRYARSATGYVQATKTYIEQVPGAAEALELLFGSIWPQASAATRLIAHFSSNTNIHDPDRIERVIVGDKEEADRAIQFWDKMERPKQAFVEFAYNLDQAQREMLIRYFREKGAETILWDPDKWIEEEPYYML